MLALALMAFSRELKMINGNTNSHGFKLERCDQVGSNAFPLLLAYLCSEHPSVSAFLYATLKSLSSYEF